MAQKRDGVWTWIHSDHLHSATVITDENGNEVRRLAYRAFGEEAANSGSGAAPTYTYTDKERDRSGLLYYGARYYDPELSRWLGCDPALEKLFHKKDVHEKISPMMLNHYSYSLNNPIRYYDPDGQEPVKAFADTTSTFIKLFYSTKSQLGTKIGQEAESALIYLGSTKWDWKRIKLPAATPPFNNKKGRYIYTQKGGWIDMSHFLFYAGRAYKYKSEGEEYPIGEAMQEGYQQERIDTLVSRHSAYSYEDLPSDLYGAKFAVEYFDPHSKLTLGEQLENYLTKELEATLPQNAPNWSSLPSKDHRNKPTATNKSPNPMYTMYPKNYYNTPPASVWQAMGDEEYLRELFKEMDNRE